MSVVADFTVPTRQFALREALVAVPEVEVEFERVVTHSQEWVMPFLWARGSDLDAFERAVADDPTVASAEITDDFDEVVLFRIEWSEDIERTINAIFDKTGTLLEASGREGRWSISARFDGRDPLGDLRDHLTDEGLGFSLERLYTPNKPRQLEYELTADQHETLLLAVERGYFDIPRGTTVAEMADELGISTNSVSERLRRAITTLSQNALSFDVASGRWASQEGPSDGREHG